MSYINDALKKAQEEKTGSYEYHGGIISRPPEKKRIWGKRGLLVGVFSCIVLIAGGWAAFNWERWIGEKPGTIAAKPVRTIIVDRAPPTIGKIGVQGTSPALPNQGRGALKPLPASDPTPGADMKPTTPPAVEAPVVKEAGTAVQSLYRQALALQKKKNLAGAADFYRQVVRLDPKHAYAWNNLGVIYLRQKETRRAIAAFQRAAALKARYTDPYYNMACAYAQSDDKEQSLRYLKKAAALDGEVMTWAREDTDLTNIVQMPEFNRFVEEQGK